MGVNDLMKKIRDGENHWNTRLKNLIPDATQRILVGIDMSITIIKITNEGYMDDIDLKVVVRKQKHFTKDT
jgi:hypothetical protein